MGYKPLFKCGFYITFQLMGERRYKTELKALGKRIKEIRMKRGLVQLDVEISSGINRTDISRIENGNKNIEFLTIVKIAEALDVELYELFRK